MKSTNKDVIGRAEQVDFPELGLSRIGARIDTGAKTSSVWASVVEHQGSELRVVLFDKGNPHYTGKQLVFTSFDTTVVSTSTGEVQERFKVQLLVKLGNRRIRSWFTLADRSTQVYPVLVGRNTLLGKFVVDVKQGVILKEYERQRTQKLKAALKAKQETS